MSTWNDVPAVPLTLRPTVSPAAMLVAVVKPSMPLWLASTAPGVFHPCEPGRQFSVAMALLPLHVAARGVAMASVELGELPAPELAMTWYQYVVPLTALGSVNDVAVIDDATTLPVAPDGVER
jgi:hypothetical protein